MTTKQVFNTSAELDYPKVLPTLDLDFANAKTLDPRITFTRASGGSYVSANGLIKYAGVNEARFDHDPATGESLGLLIEESRTNLFTRSEEFDLWIQANLTSIPGSSISPEGKLNATNLVENNTRNAHLVSRDVGTVTSGITYTVSCFAKSTNPNRFFSIIYSTSSLFGGNFPRASFNLQTGTVITQTLGTASIQDYGNGWYRCSISATPTATGTLTIQLRLQDQTTAVTMIGPYTGDGVSGLFIWGAQLEVGSFPTSYIPTQASTRTRASDSVQIVGKNFTNFFNKNEGTTLITYRPRFDGVYQSPFSDLFGIRDNISSNSTIGLSGNINSTQLYFIGSSASLETALVIGFTFFSPPLPNSKRTERAVISYGNDYIRMYHNSIPFISTSPLYGAGKIADLAKTRYSPSSVNYVRLIFGGDPNINARFNCTIQNFRYYPKDLGPQLLKNISQIYP